nr:unnamed protein product [Digitaria exilis]
MKVTLNSLSRLAWLLSLRRHACSGGAPPSKSNCNQKSNGPQVSHQRPPKRETKRIRRDRGGSERTSGTGLTSCSAVRPTYSSAGHEFFRQWKMWPLTIPPALPPKCYLLILTPFLPPHPAPQPRAARPGPRQPPPIGGARGRRSAGQAPSRAPPAGARTLVSTPPHHPRASADRFVAPWGSAGARGRDSDGRLARAGRIGPNPTALLPVSSSSPRVRAGAPQWCVGVEKEDDGRSAAQRLALLEEKKKKKKKKKMGVLLVGARALGQSGRWVGGLGVYTAFATFFDGFVCGFGVGIR